MAKPFSHMIRSPRRLRNGGPRKQLQSIETLESRTLFSGGSISGTVTGTAPGETIYLDANNNSKLDATEVHTTTSSAGAYGFSSVPTGSYIIRQVLPAGYQQVSPANNYGLHITLNAGASLTNQNFSDKEVTTGGSISGTVTGGVVSETIYLDANNNSKLDAGELKATTTAAGAYSFSGVPAAAYVVRQVLPSGYVQTSPSNNYGIHVTVTNGSSFKGENFTDTTAAQSLTVVFTTRYSAELVVTATGKSDVITVSESGSTLQIVADGTTYTKAAPADGLFIYTRGGTDTISIDSSVTASTVIETIDGSASTVSSASSAVTAWTDSKDTFTGSGFDHMVSSFAGGVSMATGASLPNPTDEASNVKTLNLSLFGSGPVVGDVNQGAIGDCYMCAPLAGLANKDPLALTQTMVDMGDGTYVVQFLSGNSEQYVRVSNQFYAGPYGGFGQYGLTGVHPGANNTVWAVVYEKAYAFERSGANTYSSLDAGWPTEVYNCFGIHSATYLPNNFTSSSLYSTFTQALAAGQSVMLLTPSGSLPDLIGDHAYTVISTSTSSGSGMYHIRNPRGAKGGSAENAQGYADISYNQLLANVDAFTVTSA